jgi:hypothetical protein
MFFATRFYSTCPKQLNIITITCGIYNFKKIVTKNISHQYENSLYHVLVNAYKFELYMYFNQIVLELVVK